MFYPFSVGDWSQSLPVLVLIIAFMLYMSLLQEALLLKRPPAGPSSRSPLKHTSRRGIKN